MAPPLTKDFPQNAEGPGDGWNPLSAMPGTLTNRERRNDVTVRKNIILAAAAVAAMVVTAAGAAGADPTPPPPSPGYQIPTPNGPAFPGVQSCPPRCLAAMLACGFRYDPGTGTWNPGDPDGV
jgi:hypothetical protein